MAKVTAVVSRPVTASPERVLEFLRDYRSKRRTILTKNYRDFRVEEGGIGSGTVFSYRFIAGGRQRDYRLRVEESDGQIIERDELSSFVCTWGVTPVGETSAVTIEGTWQGGQGIGGLFEGLFAPAGLRRIYRQVLIQLARAVRAESG